MEPLLLEQLRLHKRMWRVGALTLAAMMIGCGALAKLLFSEAESLGVLRLAGLGLLVAAFLALPSLGDPSQTRPAKTLRDRAQQIVWIYLAELRGQSAGQFVVLGLDDGTRVWFPAMSKRREGEVLAAVARLVPWATQGFTPTIELAFMRDPSSLREAREALR